MNKKIQAPFSPAEVVQLTAWQNGPNHPFTCQNHSATEHVLLVPTENGWVCSDKMCTHTQNWAHSFMINATEA